MINTLVPSMAAGMVQPGPIEGIFKDTVAAFWNDDRITSEEAMARLLKAARKPN